MKLKNVTIAEIAQIVDGEVIGKADTKVNRVASLERAKEQEVSFLTNPSFAEQLNTTRAGCVLLSDTYKKSDWEQVNQSKEGMTSSWVLCKDPYLAYAKIAQLLDTTPLLTENTKSNETIHPSAKVGKNVSFGSGVVVSENCLIGDNVVIGCNSFVGPNSIVGDGTIICPNVTIYHDIKIGNSCLFHAGVVIGSDGFGFANEKGKWIKIPQTGGVVIGDRVEIGANTCIDRGALNDTIISDGVKIDNLCHIAHNVEFGEDSAMAACSGVAGSTKIGSSCTFSGRTSIIGHLDIAAGTHITAGTLVNRSNKEAGVFSSGTGMQENKVWRKNVARFKQLDSMSKKIKELEKQLKELKGD